MMTYGWVLEEGERIASGGVEGQCRRAPSVRGPWVVSRGRPSLRGELDVPNAETMFVSQQTE